MRRAYCKRSRGKFIPKPVGMAARLNVQCARHLTPQVPVCLMIRLLPVEGQQVPRTQARGPGPHEQVQALGEDDLLCHAG